MCTGIVPLCSFILNFIVLLVSFVLQSSCNNPNPHQGLLSVGNDPPQRPHGGVRGCRHDLHRHPNISQRRFVVRIARRAAAPPSPTSALRSNPARAFPPSSFFAISRTMVPLPSLPPIGTAPPSAIPPHLTWPPVSFLSSPPPASSNRGTSRTPRPSRPRKSMQPAPTSCPY